MNIYDEPWQAWIGKMLRLALEYARKSDEFDKHVGYLLLDISVENALKAYLKNSNVEYKQNINFPELVNTVKQQLEKTNNPIVRNIGNLTRYHDARNSLYHQAGAIQPSKDYLEKYSTLAQEIISALININVAEIASNNMVWGNWEGLNEYHWEGNRTIEEIISEFSERLKYFYESCAILSEQLRPKLATRRFALELQNIWKNYRYEGHKDDWGDFIDGSETEVAEMRMSIAEERLRLADERLRLFGEAIEKNIEKYVENYEFVDLVLESVNHLFVRIALQELSANIEEDWDKYLNVFRTISDSRYARMDAQAINQEYKTILSCNTFANYAVETGSKTG